MKLYNILYDWLKSRLRFGSWYVLYPDGKNSRPMSYRIAKDYAEMFGGEVLPTDKPIYDRGLR